MKWLGAALLLMGLGSVAWAQGFFSRPSFWKRNGTDLVYTDGEVGIGTSSPGYGLEVSGTIRLKGHTILQGGGTSQEVWDLDANDDYMPSETGTEDALWESDSNLDIQPRGNRFEADTSGDLQPL